MKFNKNLKRLKGDASFRIFFRKKEKNLSSIIVFANKDKKKNLLVYDAINKFLIMNNILAPKLLNKNYPKNYIEIEDFGNQTVFKLLKKKSINKLEIFKKVIKLLCKIQLIKQRQIKDFKKKNYKIPTYQPKILLAETKLFLDWYISKNLRKSKQFIFKKKFIKIFKGKLVNFHPSLLPEERGGANFSYRILEKKKFSAASAHFVDEKIDSGDIIFQIKKFNIKKYDLYEYFFKTYENYNGLFKKILNSMKKKKKLNRTAQLNINATYFKKLKSDIHGKINFNWDIEDIDLFIKAFGRPYKGSYCFHRDKKVYILSSRIYSKIKVHPFLFGKVKNINKDGSILVFCNNGILKVEDVSLNKNIIKADKIFKLSSWLK